MANEKRLIDANAIEMAMNERYMELVGEYGHYDHYTEGYGDGLYAVENAPTVDAVEVVHGRWLGTHDGWYYSYSCSECGAEALTKEETMHDQVCSNYCPNCGADMRERKDND